MLVEIEEQQQYILEQQGMQETRIDSVEERLDARERREYQAARDLLLDLVNPPIFPSLEQ